jgi:heptosyltransferase III
MEKTGDYRPGAPVRGPATASLVYHAGALGDFITALPALSAWRRRHPGARIVLLGRPLYAALAAAPLPFDETWDAGAAVFAPLFAAGTPPGPLAERCRPFSSALLFSGAASPLAANLAAAGVEGILRHEPFPAGPVPIVDYHLSLFPPSATGEDDRLPRVRTDGAPLEGPSRPVVIHPGSGSPRKNWARERFDGLAERLERDGQPVVWLTGPAEDSLARGHRAPAWRSPPLAALAATLSRALLFVGNDSGVAHLAAAAGCPTVSLFGASDERVWAPRGPVVRVVKRPGGGMEAISVEDVYVVCRSVMKETGPG